MPEREPTTNASLPLADLNSINEVAGADLRRLKGAHFFITGGTGYIGRWLLESLCNANRQLKLQIKATVLSRRPGDFAKRNPHLARDECLKLVEGDVRDFSINGEKYSHLIHGATDIAANTSDLDLFHVAVTGSRHIMNFARAHGVENVLLLSSGAVYGQFPDGVARASEALPCVANVSSQRSAYGLGKIASEWLINTYGQQWGLSCKSARLFAQIGPNLPLDAHFAAGNFIRDVLQREPITIRGNGSALRSYMYAIDMVTWLWAILVRGQAASVYNVGSEQAVSIQDLARTVNRVAGANEGNIRQLGRPDEGVAPSHYLPDTTLARKELGLELTVPLEDAVRRTLHWSRLRQRSLAYD